MEKVLQELHEQLSYAEMEDAGDDGYAHELQNAIEILGKIEEDGHMYDNTLTGLLQAGHSYFGRNEADYMLVWIEGVTPNPELIINPRENFEDKLKYYAGAYTEGLCLNHNEDIKIARFEFVTLEELADKFSLENKNPKVAEAIPEVEE